MKGLRRILFAFVMIVSMAVISPNIVTGQTTTVHAATKINKTKVTLIKGQTTTLKVTGTKKKITWSSSRKSVATVSSKGKVTAKKVGTAKITAKVNGKKYTCTIKVQEPKLSKTKLNVTVGNKYTLKMSGTDQKISWKSSNTSVATVNNKGVITTKKVGTAKITATVLKKSYTCNLTVKKQVEEFDDVKAKKNVKVTSRDTGDGVVAVFENNYKFQLGIEAKVVYFKSGKTVDIVTQSENGLESGRKMFLSFYAPQKNGRDVEYDSYKLSFDIMDDYELLKGESSKISVDSSLSYDEVLVSVKNNSKYTLSSIQLVLVHYDEDGNIIQVDDEYAECYKPNKTDYISFGFDHINGVIAIPYRYEVYVNCAYRDLE